MDQSRTAMHIPNIICICCEVAVEVPKLSDAAFFFISIKSKIIYGSHFIIYTRCVYCIGTYITLNAHQQWHVHIITRHFMEIIYYYVFTYVPTHVNITYIICLYCRRKSTYAMVPRCTGKIHVWNNSIMLCEFYII